ncbi:MAG TPA: ABC transporter permease [Chryseolinea sp.]|nr:ABC transporter permease [Chryseolinea sp.]HPM31038.1 ABC transporter permease [Chryseolinea sp.]
MLKHYWVTAIRNLTRNKLFSSINAVGLSISIAIFLALIGYVRYQFSYDSFYKNGEKIYRINYYEYQQGQPILQTARTHDRTALIIHEYVPQIEAVTRVYNEKAYVFTEDIRIVDQDMLFVDSSFFKVFPVNIISGSSEKALIAPHTVMVSKSQAEVYFGKEDPMGKILYFNERLAFTVTGVFEDIPSNSSIDFDFLLSWSTIPFNGWSSKEGSFDSAPSNFTFVRLRENVSDIEAVNKALTDMANKHITNLEKRGHTAKQELRPYVAMHTSPDLSGEVKPGTNKVLLYSLLSLAIFILVAAWINYINLSLARSLERADEIGVRKVFGATRFAISGQFLLEALILSVITFFIGCGLYLLFTQPLANVFFTNVTFLTPNIATWFLYFFGFVLGTALIAFYPAHFISKYKPALILKNKLGSGRGKANILHQGLMVFQLFLAIAIVGITFIAGRQINFMHEFDSGFNAQQTITLRAPASTNSDSLRQTRFKTFRSEVLQHHAFKSGTASMNVPGEEIRFHDEGVHAVGSENIKKQSFWNMWIDEGYQETFGMTLLKGRNFNEKEFGKTCIVNETAATALGFAKPEEAVNTSIITNENGKVIIVGVWKDYHQESVRKSVDPVIFYHHHPHEYGYYSFNVQSREGDYLEALQSIWKKHYPNDQFIYYFMDRFFEEQYRADELFGKLLNLFSVISIVVSSLGLFGMASLAMVKRTKEIGVRKVLGASVWNILVMLSTHYVKLILIGCAFAFPLAYYLTYQWLEGFAYKIEISWWMIILPGILVLLATLLTIATQSVRAALANPAKSLRDQ